MQSHAVTQMSVDDEDGLDVGPSDVMMTVIMMMMMMATDTAVSCCCCHSNV